MAYGAREVICSCVDRLLQYYYVCVLLRMDSYCMKCIEANVDLVLHWLLTKTRYKYRHDNHGQSGVRTRDPCLVPEISV